jgi:short subunit dehydrogenase-like uncharacterized protein
MDGKNMSKEFDVVIWGATGFTGQLVVEYILSSYGDSPPFTWAVAARNEKKLEEVLSTLSFKYPAAQNLPKIIADSFDRTSLDKMTQRSKVICTTVGPYSKYGSDLVASCIEHATHYCDLTGESPFVKEMIELHHERAIQQKCRIVHFCGFDSIPSDIGTQMLQEEYMRQTQTYLDEVCFYMGPSKGGFSGGTIASMLHLFERLHDPKIRRTLGNPYSLDPKDGIKKPRVSDAIGLKYDKDIQKWIGPFIMAGTNTKAVRRSHALLKYPYGHHFRYQEVMSMPNFLMALGLTVGLTSFISLAAFPPTRKLLQKFFLPKPGEGPSEDLRENGFFVIYLIGKKNGQVVCRGTVKGQKDPGYGETSKMLAESALCLALEDLPANYGIITPAYAMGEPLLHRLRKAGMTFEATIV